MNLVLCIEFSEIFKIGLFGDLWPDGVKCYKNTGNRVQVQIFLKIIQGFRKIFLNQILANKNYTTGIGSNCPIGFKRLRESDFWPDGVKCFIKIKNRIQFKCFFSLIQGCGMFYKNTENRILV